jgi:hypothetical protein
LNNRNKKNRLEDEIVADSAAVVETPEENVVDTHNSSNSDKVSNDSNIDLNSPNKGIGEDQIDYSDNVSDTNTSLNQGYQLHKVSIRDKTNNESKNKIMIGSQYQGGIICYIDETGKHGIIITEKIIGSAEWGCKGKEVIPNLNGGEVDVPTIRGDFNTESIIRNCNELQTAAKLCNDLILNGYDDWVLPTSYEFEKMDINDNEIYWTSTELDKKYALCRHPKTIDYLNKNNSYKKNEVYKVKAIRYF